MVCLRKGSENNLALNLKPRKKEAQCLEADSELGINGM